MAGKKIDPVKTKVSEDPSELRPWKKENGTELMLNGHSATIEAAVALGWTPA